MRERLSLVLIRTTSSRGLQGASVCACVCAKGKGLNDILFFLLIFLYRLNLHHLFCFLCPPVHTASVLESCFSAADHLFCPVSCNTKDSILVHLFFHLPASLSLHLLLPFLTWCPDVRDVAAGCEHRPTRVCFCPVFTGRVAPKPRLMKSKQGCEEETRRAEMRCGTGRAVLRKNVVLPLLRLLR